MKNENGNWDLLGNYIYQVQVNQLALYNKNYPIALSSKLNWKLKDSGKTNFA